MTKSVDFIDKLRKSGLRPTRQRLKICEVLFDRDTTFHFTINDLTKIISEKLNEKIETIFLMSDVENQIISSKFVKEIAKLDGKINKFLTKSVVKKLINKLE